MLKYPFISVPLALVPNLMMIIPVIRTCRKRDITAWPWVLLMAVCPPVALTWMVAKYSAPVRRRKAVLISAIGSLIICGSFLIAALVLESV